MPKPIAYRAMKITQDYYSRQGYLVQDVSTTRGHNGYDLIARRGRSKLKIEVKACSRPWKIPDLYATEFDANRRLVANILYVVYFASGGAQWACAIPRRAIPADCVQPKGGYRIAGRFKNEKALAQFKIELRPRRKKDDSRPGPSRHRLKPGSKTPLNSSRRKP